MKTHGSLVPLTRSDLGPPGHCSGPYLAKYEYILQALTASLIINLGRHKLREIFTLRPCEIFVQGSVKKLIRQPPAYTTQIEQIPPIQINMTFRVCTVEIWKLQSRYTHYFSIVDNAHLTFTYFLLFVLKAKEKYPNSKYLQAENTGPYLRDFWAVCVKLLLPNFGLSEFCWPTPHIFAYLGQ